LWHQSKKCGFEQSNFALKLARRREWPGGGAACITAMRSASRVRGRKRRAA
jgi:hypothetical protein